ncbi:MAG: hypothetical protein AAF652_17510, partial [Cyanobacteria bacterium P01_C01_bin.72]
VPSTDLYGLGATIVYLLTHSKPTEFLQDDGKIDFRTSINVSQQMTDWLEIMLEPNVGDRFESASQSLAALKGDLKVTSRKNPPIRQPSFSKIAMSKTKNQISFTIPHNKGEPGDLNNRLILLYISLFLIALIFPSVNASSELSLSNDLIIRLILSIPVITAQSYFSFNYLFSTFGVTEVKIGQENFDLTYNLFGLKRKISGETKDITNAKIGYNILSGYSEEEQYGSRSVVARCFIVEGIRAKQFGRYIKRVEKEWLIEEINNFLGKLIDH